MDASMKPMMRPALPLCCGVFTRPTTRTMLPCANRNPLATGLEALCVGVGCAGALGATGWPSSTAVQRKGRQQPASGASLKVDRRSCSPCEEISIWLRVLTSSCIEESIGRPVVSMGMRRSTTTAPAATKK